MPVEPRRRPPVPVIRSRLDWLRLRRRDRQWAKRVGAAKAAQVMHLGRGVVPSLRAHAEVTRNAILEGVKALETTQGTETPSDWVHVFEELRKAEAPLLDIRSLGRALRERGLSEFDKRVYSFGLGDAFYCFGLGGSRIDYTHLRIAVKKTEGAKKRVVVGTREEVVPKILALFGEKALLIYSVERGWPFDERAAREVSLEAGRKSLHNLSLDRFLDRILVGYTRRQRQASGAKWRTVAALDRELASAAARHGLSAEELSAVRKHAEKIAASGRGTVAAAVSHAVQKRLEARAAAQAQPAEARPERETGAARVEPAQPPKREVKTLFGLDRAVLHEIGGLGFKAEDLPLLRDAGLVEGRLLQPANSTRLVARLRELNHVRGLLETAKKWAEHPDAKMGPAGYLAILLSEKKGNNH